MSVSLTFAAAVTLTMLDEYQSASLASQFRQAIEIAVLRVPGVIDATVVYSADVSDKELPPLPTGTENADADHQPTSPQ